MSLWFRLANGDKKPTSSYMNCSVSADLPTPPLPTIITLCITSGCWCITAGCLVFVCDMVRFTMSNNQNPGGQNKNEPLCEKKKTIWVSDQVQHKPACTVTEAGQKLEILDFRRRVCVAKTKALNSFVVTAKLVCVFVFVCIRKLLAF